VTPPEYYCPACGKPVAATESQHHALQCSHCAEQFFIPGEAPEESGNHVEAFGDVGLAAPTPSADDSELSELRIRQLSNLRRGAYRSRSWLLIGSAACLVGAAKLIEMCVVAARHKMLLASIGDAMGAVAALMICRHFVRRARVLTHEIAASRLADPIAPPDLSTLNDGSQRWRNLEQLTGGDRPAPSDDRKNSHA